MDDDLDDWGDDENLEALLQAVDKAEQQFGQKQQSNPFTSHNGARHGPHVTVNHLSTVRPSYGLNSTIHPSHTINNVSYQTPIPPSATTHSMQVRPTRQPSPPSNPASSSLYFQPSQIQSKQSITSIRSFHETNSTNQAAGPASSASRNNAITTSKSTTHGGGKQQASILSMFSRMNGESNPASLTSGNASGSTSFSMPTTVRPFQKIKPSAPPKPIVHNHPFKPSEHEMDDSQTSTWIYPINMPVRDYQYNIVQTALMHNTLVALPTGLGKTFIAAVVMFNFYRWFPKGKIIFAAPTRPLVTQQIDACINIVGIPRADTQELTGSINPAARKTLWEEKRVFFLTPHVMQNDLKAGICPFENVVLLVIDEAHKATGNYAYTEIVSLLAKQEAVFRVLALTATPGADARVVQSVVDSLLIEQIEVRTEESMDVKPYIFHRSTEKQVVQLSPLIARIVQLFEPIVEHYTAKLAQQRAIYDKNWKNLSTYQIIQARERWRKSLPADMHPALRSAIEGDFALAMSLIGAYGLLTSHGIVSFYNVMKGYIEEATKPNAKISSARAWFIQHPKTTEILSVIQSEMTSHDFSSHPKMVKLLDVVLSHFSAKEDQRSAARAEGRELAYESRVMIFAKFRDVVEEIVNLLKPHAPMIRVMSFVGQSAGKRGSSSKGYSQKEQLQIITKFQEAKCNVLVCTSIGEEGLDIGDVDLIICYDSQSSPIQLLQRMGRTGRKRQGRAVILLTAGKEEDSFQTAQARYKSVQRALVDPKRLNLYTGFLARVLPPGSKPACVQKTIQVEEKQVTSKKLKRGGSLGSAHQRGRFLEEYIDERKKSAMLLRNGQLSIHKSMFLHTIPLQPKYVPLSWTTSSFFKVIGKIQNLCDKEAGVESIPPLLPPAPMPTRPPIIFQNNTATTTSCKREPRQSRDPITITKQSPWGISPPPEKSPQPIPITIEASPAPSAMEVDMNEYDSIFEMDKSSPPMVQVPDVEMEDTAKKTVFRDLFPMDPLCDYPVMNASDATKPCLGSQNDIRAFEELLLQLYASQEDRPRSLLNKSNSPSTKIFSDLPIPQLIKRSFSIPSQDQVRPDVAKISPLVSAESYETQKKTSPKSPFRPPRKHAVISSSSPNQQSPFIPPARVIKQKSTIFSSPSTIYSTTISQKAKLVNRVDQDQDMDDFQSSSPSCHRDSKLYRGRLAVVDSDEVSEVSHSPAATKQQQSLKNGSKSKLNAFIELEADMSSIDGSHGSDDDNSHEEDRDLSGLIASDPLDADVDYSSQSVTSQVAMYHQLRRQTPDIRIVGNQRRSRYSIGSCVSSSGFHGGGVDQDEVGSLVDFVVSDDEDEL